METVLDIKERIVSRINSINDMEQLKEIEDTLFSTDECELTKEEKEIVDSRTAKYLKGEAKTLSWEELKSFAKGQNSAYA
jgi:hypothetical protein